MATAQPSSTPTRTLTPVPSMPPDAFEVVAARRDPEATTLSSPMLTRTGSPAASSYRVLVHRLERRGQPQVVAVTSARRREGKTTVALNLAAALAEKTDRRVLLVEATHLHPALGRGLGIDVPSSLDGQLERAAEPAPMTWITLELRPGLEILAMAPTCAKGELAPPPAYRRLLEHARRRYAHVVLDCPSVACAGEVSVVDDLADGTLLVARGGHTRARDLRAALAQLAPARILGAVLVGGEV